MDTAIDLEFGDGRYHLALPMPQVLELERVCGQAGAPKSVFLIYEQLSQGLVRVDGADEVRFLSAGAAHALDINETIRLALIGGGSGEKDGVEVKVGPITAKRLVELYAYPAVPLADAMVTAWAILNAAITGVSLKKKAPDVAEVTAPSVEAAS